jgi:hypothetical protein
MFAFLFVNLKFVICKGMQNFGIALLIVSYNFPSPESDYAILPLLALTAMTNIPLCLALFAIKLVSRTRACIHKKSKAKVVDQLKNNSNSEVDDTIQYSVITQQL